MAAVSRLFKPLRNRRFWMALWAAAVLGVVVVCLIPPPPLPPLPDNSDKLEHFAAYAVLSAGAVQLFARWSALLGAGIGLVLLGIGMEYAQGAFTDYRVLDARDALANTIGVIAGLGTQLTPLRDLLLRLDRRRDQS